MKKIDRLERRFGKYAIHNLMYYIVIMQVVGLFLGFINPTFVYKWLTLDISKVLHGQIWRLVTFIGTTYSFALIKVDVFNLLMIAIELYLYYYISRSLESVWGAFRFNLYYFSGIFFNIIAAVIIYVVCINAGVEVPFYVFGLEYINQSLLLAFATLFPEVQLLYMMFIPLKVKYIGYFTAAYLVYEVINCFMNGLYVLAISIMVALLNFLLFFFLFQKTKRTSPKQMKRRVQYQREVHSNDHGPRHRCVVCGRTELDDENLEFRYCSRCDGNYEYCMEHLFTHEHVHKK